MNPTIDPAMNPGSLDRFARSILFGTRLEDKLAALSAEPGAELPELSSWMRPEALRLENVPAFPGRPPGLAVAGKAEFPRDRLLESDSSRGRILHFFANHELLAMELMALVLLRFPDAPAAFRSGLARTIGEEQEHLRLYLGRMRALGVEFGELPVSDYFWNAMKGMRSPLQFVTQMSLTFEQANLDFSLHYRDAVAKAGDHETAAILDRVYREEIGHVKHGLAWFNRWRAESAGSVAGESDWDAYLRLLPPPMTAGRAKGPAGQEFSVEGRRQAGLSERFISELTLCSASKGRPPTYWLYNPSCDSEIARGKPGFSASQATARQCLDLEHAPLFLALGSDIVLARELPGREWLGDLHAAGFAIPEFRPFRPNGQELGMPREEKIAGVEPWGWSPDAFARFQPWRSRLVGADGANGAWAARILGDHADFAATGLGRIFSKAWSAEFYRDWLRDRPEDQIAFGGESTAGRAVTEAQEARALLLSEPPGHWLIKAPWSTSGAGNRRLLAHSELEGPLGGWLRNTIAAQGSVVIEPWLAADADLSLQIEIGGDSVRLLGARRFLTGPRLEYRGAWLDPKLASLGSEWLRFLHGPLEPLARWERMARALGQRLREAGYQGPAGIDALLWRTRAGEPRLKALVELNPRWTMGRVALALERKVQPGVPAVWRFIPAREARARGHDGLAGLADSLRSEHPLQPAQGARDRFKEGVLFTNDPRVARETLSVLAIGQRALSSLTPDRVASP